MEYYHTPRFIAVLHAAVRFAHARARLLDKTIVRDAKLQCGRSTLYRFMNSDLSREASLVKLNVRPTEKIQGALSFEDASRLWDFLWARGFVTQAMQERGWNRRELWDLRDHANAVMSAFNADNDQLADIVDKRIEGKYFAYRLSNRMPGYVAKTLWEITSVKGEFLQATETMRYSGHASLDGGGFETQSKGFGYMQSGTLWFHMLGQNGRQTTASLPAVRVTGNHGTKEISMLFGSLAGEDVSKGSGVLGHQRILFIKQEYDRRVTEGECPGIAYNPQGANDFYRLGDDGLALPVGKQAVSNRLVSFLHDGHYDGCIVRPDEW